MNPIRRWKRTKFTMVFIILSLAVTACSSALQKSQSVETAAKSEQESRFFQLEGLNNRTIDSSKVIKPMFVSFWATWCHYCKEEMPFHESLFREYDGRVEFAAVNLTHLDSEKNVKDYIQEHDYSLPVYLDKEGAVTELFQVISTPTVVLLDRQGKIVHKKIGAGGKNSMEEYRKLLDNLLSDNDEQGG
jgi:cytochrome c biogenesis protein CcmG/thiol:disulfide interchange protein DsbE